MKVAIISDIHGNLVSLNAVLADIDRRGVDSIVCLGDVFASGPKPIECLGTMQRLACPVVLGNTDQRFLGNGNTRLRAAGREGDILESMDRWIASQLSSAHIDFVKSFRKTVKVDLGNGQSLLCYHGSPASNTQLITAATGEDSLREMFDWTHDIYAGGHSHVQMLRVLGPSMIVNPGSVGAPLHVMPDGRKVRRARAEYAVLNAGVPDLRFEFCRLEVSLDDIARDARSSGMPYAEEWVRDWQRSDEQDLTKK